MMISSPTFAVRKLELTSASSVAPPKSSVPFTASCEYCVPALAPLSSAWNVRPGASVMALDVSFDGLPIYLTSSVPLLPPIVPTVPLPWSVPPSSVTALTIDPGTLRNPPWTMVGPV